MFHSQKLPHTRVLVAAGECSWDSVSLRMPPAVLGMEEAQGPTHVLTCGPTEPRVSHVRTLGHSKSLFQIKTCT